ncbi:centrosome-associated zinc finger protein CP190-like [Paramacrobiotus metropolitanus]|uniref:centrosome-associated zinc finger protein CP190-like n=1 Tax=Paramacrobiotus metropolitanus TaxID=2943436 RepID=UPI0024459134|nr:centrosome-associated zinc finger protein CP190-like [Paramacrobiotus metropolitanus]
MSAMFYTASLAFLLCSFQLATSSPLGFRENYEEDLAQALNGGSIAYDQQQALDDALTSEELRELYDSVSDDSTTISPAEETFTEEPEISTDATFPDNHEETEVTATEETVTEAPVEDEEEDIFAGFQTESPDEEEPATTASPADDDGLVETLPEETDETTEPPLVDDDEATEEAVTEETVTAAPIEDDDIFASVQTESPDEDEPATTASPADNDDLVETVTEAVTAAPEEAADEYDEETSATEVVIFPHEEVEATTVAPVSDDVSDDDDTALILIPPAPITNDHFLPNLPVVIEIAGDNNEDNSGATATDEEAIATTEASVPDDVGADDEALLGTIPAAPTLRNNDDFPPWDWSVRGPWIYPGSPVVDLTNTGDEDLFSSLNNTMPSTTAVEPLWNPMMPPNFGLHETARIDDLNIPMPTFHFAALQPFAGSSYEMDVDSDATDMQLSLFWRLNSVARKACNSYMYSLPTPPEMAGKLMTLLKSELPLYKWNVFIGYALPDTLKYTYQGRYKGTCNGNTYFIWYSYSDTEATNKDTN